MAAKKPAQGRASAKAAAAAKRPAKAKTPVKGKGPARSKTAAKSSKAGTKALTPPAKRAVLVKKTSAQKSQGQGRSHLKKISKTSASGRPKRANTGLARTGKAAKSPPKAKPTKADGARKKIEAGSRSGKKEAADSRGADGKSYTRLKHIDDATLDQIIAKLEDMRAESLVVVNMKKSDSGPINEQSGVGDDMDLASQDRDREFNLLMHERHLRRLQQIDDAFERIREGTYGLCEGTEEPINPRRLMIMPLARYSIEYQQEQEKMLGRTPDEFYFEEEAAIENEEE